jgi:hypothetical protein
VKTAVDEFNKKILDEGEHEKNEAKLLRSLQVHKKMKPPETERKMPTSNTSKSC